MSPQVGVYTGVDADADIAAHAAIAGVHHAKTSKASEITSETFDDARIPAAIARDTEVTTAIGNHADDPDAHHSELSALEFIIDGGGSAITLGEKGYLRVPFDCEIERVTLMADQDGDIKIDIWNDTYGNFPPTNADSICASAEPEISSAQKYKDTTLTGWTTALAKGDILAFNVDSCTTITRCTVSLRVIKS